MSDDLRVEPYLTFDGDCEEALELYARCLGGTLRPIFRYEGSPMASRVPASWSNKVMHATLELDGRVLMGADSPPGSYEEPSGFTLSIQMSDTDRAERVFRELSEGGQVVMPLQETFWSKRFGVFVDRFGTPWQINCE